jgi:hypothetical protein
MGLDESSSEDEDKSHAKPKTGRVF